MKDESQKQFRLFSGTLKLPARMLIITVFLAGCFGLSWSGWKLTETLDNRSLVLIVLASISSGFAIRIPVPARRLQSLSITLSDIFIFVAIFAERPELAVVIGAVEALISSYRVRVSHAHKWIFNVGLLTSAALLSGWAFLQLAGGTSSFKTLIPSALVAIVVYFGLNSLLISAVISLSVEQQVWTIWSKNLLWAAPSTLANGLSAICLMLVLSSLGGPMEVAMLPVVLVIFSAHRIHRRSQEREAEAK
ncbi:MAG TPA: hypothetical protein VKZ59_12940 [Acidobacteriota bacterium]|nr:hypothetical protein [Acidobacteriota bacterium]